MMSVMLWLQHNSLLMMLAVFVMIVATTFWPGRRTTFDKISRIPLDDDR
jgi:cbb3-type cytochrome oxidase subunit 3